jgi:hypothetical protein
MCYVYVAMPVELSVSKRSDSPEEINQRLRRIPPAIGPQHPDQTGRIHRVGLREVHASRWVRSGRTRRIRYIQQTVRFICDSNVPHVRKLYLDCPHSCPRYPVDGSAAGVAESEGKKLLEERCANCHSLKPVVSLKQSRGAWNKLVVKMVGYGAQLDNKEVEVATEYVPWSR